MPSARDFTYIPIKRDRGNHDIISGPHWRDNGEKIEIAGYASGRKIRVNSAISHKCTEAFWIKPKVRTTTKNNGNDVVIEIDFPAQRFENQNGEPQVVEYEKTAESSLLKKMTDYFDNSFPIEWEFAKDAKEGDPSKPGSFISFKTTYHTLCVTRNFPVSAEDVYETTIYLGCLHAKGKSKNAGIVDAIWVPFDKTVFNVNRYGDGKKFTYWNSCLPETCLELPQLLATKTDTNILDGRCHAMRNLLAAIIYTQGIPILDPNVSIEANDMFTNSNMADLEAEFGVMGTNATWKELETVDKEGQVGTNDYMAVKEWGTFIAGSSNNLFELNAPPEGCPSNWVHWATGDPGLKGQGGVVDPLSLHLNHTWLKYKGTYYDPSYGVLEDSGTIDKYKSKYLDSEGGKIFEVTFNSGEVKYYYWIGKF